jgi:translocation and assembly module TamA
MALRGQFGRMRRAAPGSALAVVLALSLGLSGRPVGAFDAFDFRVSGGAGTLTRELENASALVEVARSKDETAQDVLAAARADYGRILGALYARGYYSAVITIRLDGREAADIAPLDTPSSVRRVEVTIDPGPQFRFGQATVGPLAPGTDLPDAFRRGEIAESGVIRQTAQAAIDGWRARAHAKAAVSSQDIVADHASAELDAALTITPGPALRFGRLAITGRERMSERRIRKIAGLPEGGTFDPAVLERAAERLRRTGVFASVALVEDDAITAPDRLGITANLVEQKPRRYSFGAEVSSLDGASVKGSWLNRNLFGGAERLTLSGEVRQIGAQSSGTDYALGVSLDRPATLRPDTSGSLSFGLGHFEESDYTAESARFALGFDTWVTAQASWQIGLEYQFARVTDASGEFTYRNLALPVGLLFDDRDNKLDPRRGRYLKAELRPFLGFGTTDSGLRATADLRLYRSLGEGDRFTFAGRLQLGAVTGTSLLGTPREYLFYSGGGGTVRGQPYQSLGVDLLRDVAGADIGGMAFVAASAELRARFGSRWGAVAFFDYGQVGATGFSRSETESHAGAGLGLRYDTGFGPIRLDVAAPVSGNTGKGVQVYVGIGQSF